MRRLAAPAAAAAVAVVGLTPPAAAVPPAGSVPTAPVGAAVAATSTPRVVRTGSITVDVDVPRGATSSGIPAVALAYPLDPDQAPVGATLRKGKARLSAAAGWWIVATSVPGRRGPAKVSTELVRVGGRDLRVQPAAGVGAAGVALGGVTVTGWSNDDDLSVSSGVSALTAATMASAARKAPCRPAYSPVPSAGNPLWNAIRKATGKAARTGPAPARGAARAAAARLSAGPAPGTPVLSGSVTRIGDPGSGRGSVTVRITDSSGRVISERSGTGPIGAVMQDLVAQVLDDLCNDRGRVAVDVHIVFDATDTSAGVRGTAVVTLNAIGIEPKLPDGTVERGAYEFAAPTPWVITDWQVVRAGPGTAGVDPSCGVTKTVTDAGLVEQAPTQIAVRSGTGYRVQLAPAILLGYDWGSPCSGSNAIPVSVATQPAIVVDVPGLGQTGTKAGELSPPGLTASYAVDVTVRPSP